jgi:hypothetical protein
MSKEVEKVKKKAVDDAHSLIDEARKCFGNMQRSWWEFAKSIHRIRKEDAWSKDSLGKEDGFDSFKDFCSAEYPSVDVNTIYKFCAVVDEWHDVLESRIKKDPEFRLPAYEACYRLVTAKTEVAKEEISRLRKSLMDAKISYRGLKDQLQTLIVKTKRDSAKTVEEAEETVRQLEEDLAKDLSDDEMNFDDSLFDSEVEEDADAEEPDFDDEELEEDADSSAASCKARVEYLLENLPIVELSMKKGKIHNDIVELMTSLEKLGDVANNFMNKFEEINKK